MTPPPFLVAQADAVLISLKVQPRARRTGFAGAVGPALKLQVTAPPVDSAANEAVVHFLAETLDVPRRQISILRGAASRNKVVRVGAVSLEQVAGKLMAALAGERT